MLRGVVGPGRIALGADPITRGAAMNGRPGQLARTPGRPPGNGTPGAPGRPRTYPRESDLDTRTSGTPGISQRGQVGGQPRTRGRRHPRGAQKRQDGLDRGRRASRPGGMEAHHLSHTQGALRLVRAWSTASLFNSCSESPRGGRRPGHAGRQVELRHGGGAPCSILSWHTMMQRPSWRSMAWSDSYENGEPVRTLDSLGIGKGRRRTQPARGVGRGAAAMSMMNTGPGINPPPAGGVETHGGPAS